MTKKLAPWLSLIGMLLLVELAVSFGWLHRLVVPPPSAVASYLVGGFTDGSLFHALLVTVQRLVLGFVVGLLLGVPLGFLVAGVAFVRSTLGNLALGLQALPSVCWVPLALLWFGQEEGAVLFVVVMGTVWSVILGVADGVRFLPPIYRKVAETMGASQWKLFSEVLVPASLPVVIVGMKQGWAFAWRSLLAAEIFVTILSGTGLGQLLHYGHELLAIEQVVGVMVVIVAVGVVADLFVFGRVQRSIAQQWGLDAAAR